MDLRAWYTDQTNQDGAEPSFGLKLTRRLTWYNLHSMQTLWVDSPATATTTGK